VQFGDKDFSGSFDLRALLDDGKQVSLIPAGILETANKPLNDFTRPRRAALQRRRRTSYRREKVSGEVALAKQGSNWVLRKPRELRPAAAR